MQCTWSVGLMIQSFMPRQVMDLAVGVIIGAAFGGMSSLVRTIIDHRPVSGRPSISPVVHRADGSVTRHWNGEARRCGDGSMLGCS